VRRTLVSSLARARSAVASRIVMMCAPSGVVWRRAATQRWRPSFSRSRTSASLTTPGSVAAIRASMPGTSSGCQKPIAGSPTDSRSVQPVTCSHAGLTRATRPSGPTRNMGSPLFSNSSRISSALFGGGAAGLRAMTLPKVQPRPLAYAR
jgi:hypothetical protein